jgi:hypothetical protein
MSSMPASNTVGVLMELEPISLAFFAIVPSSGISYIFCMFIVSLWVVIFYLIIVCVYWQLISAAFSLFYSHSKNREFKNWLKIISRKVIVGVQKSDDDLGSQVGCAELF